MPRIPSYPLAGSVSNDDLMIIDDVSEIYTTKSLKLSTLKGYVNTGQATTTYVDDRVVSGASFNTSTGVLTLTRTDGIDVTEDLDGRYAVTSSLAAVATSGSYNDLSDQPTIPAAYTNADVDAHLNTSTATPLEVLSWTGSDYSWVAQSGSSGTVTSVGLSMPSAFSLIGSPVTSAGVFIVTGAGNSSQYIDGTGSLQTFPTIPTVPANIVETITTTDGSFIDLTPNTATDGAVTVTADLSATGTADATTFLRGDNTWAVPPGGGGGSGVTSIIAGDGISIDPVTGTGNVTVTAGTAVASTWRTFYRKFTGNELKNAFAGSTTNEIVLVNGSPNKVIVLGVEATFFLDFSTGTTNYVDNGHSLAIYPDTASGFQFPTSIIVGSIGSITSTNPFGIRFKSTTTNYTQSAPTGAAIVLGSYSTGVSITAGDRDFILTFPYRIIDLS